MIPPHTEIGSAQHRARFEVTANGVVLVTARMLTSVLQIATAARHDASS